jgi:hypothetical protein
MWRKVAMISGFLFQKLFRALLATFGVSRPAVFGSKTFSFSLFDYVKLEGMRILIIYVFTTNLKRVEFKG